jgi:ubiquinone/menaquinone biosynthesis C-methylase UbiE
MKEKMSNFAYKMMTYVGMPFRNLFMQPNKILTEVEIDPGCHVLEYGCGPGVFTIMLAEKTGQSGLVYALDIHHLAVKTVEQKAQKKGLTNIKTILSNCSTSLPDNSLDIIVFFDVFHELDNQEEVLKELHRVLKPEAIMYFSDHHLKEDHVMSAITKKGLFKLKSKGRKTFSFSKVKHN